MVVNDGDATVQIDPIVPESSPNPMVTTSHATQATYTILDGGELMEADAPRGEPTRVASLVLSSTSLGTIVWICLHLWRPRSRARMLMKLVRNLRRAQGFKGDLWLLWDGNVVDTQVLTQSDHFIRVAAKKGYMHAEFIFAYGPPTVHRRRCFWLDLQNDINIVSGPLFIIGDFNCILSSTERIGGSGGLHPDSAEFQSFIDDLALVDLGFSGQNTTWFRGDSTLFFVAKRLDRALVNIEACLKWPSATVRHLPKFEGAWLLHPDFRAFLVGAWNGENEVVEDLSRLKPKLVRWNKMIFRNIEEKRKELLEKLDNMQRQLSRAPSQSLILEDASIQKDLDRVLQEEEVHWFQNSRELWLQAGDRNTVFFHTSTLIRRKRSMILNLKVDDGTWIEDPEVLERDAVDFFI
ncbi:hypothetical protein V2J09_019921 [Rumex salicifolius]